MPLSISEFASVSQLSAQTLRHYHAEGLLVPFEVDERTGYRSYTYDQVHRALMIAALRGAQVAVREVRAALDDPDSLSSVLADHSARLDRQREREDAALARARELVDGWPVITERQTSAASVITLRVAGSASDAAGPVVPRSVVAAARELVTDLEAAGIRTVGPAWCSHLLDTPEDKAKLQTANGPDWRCSVPVQPGSGNGDLPAGAHSQHWPAHTEVAAAATASPTVTELAAFLDRLMNHAEEHQLVPDLGRPRYLLLEDRIEMAIGVRPLTAGEDDDGDA